MIKRTYTDRATRRINVQGTNDEIELVGKLNRSETSALLELYINKTLYDQIEFTPLAEYVNELGYLYGLKLILAGYLREDVMVKVDCEPGMYAIPEYSFYVEHQLVHKEFGNEGGL